MVLTYGFLFLSLMMLSAHDIKDGILPDGWVALVAITGAIAEGHITSGLILGGLGYGLYRLYPAGLGFGDVKLMAAAGIWLPLESLPPFLVVAGVVGLLTALIVKKRRFPLGPALALALATGLMREGFILSENSDIMRACPLLPKFLKKS